MFKAEAKTSELLRQLKRCSEIIPSSVASPILMNVRMSFEKDSLKLFTTDMEAFLEASVSIIGDNVIQYSALFNVNLLCQILNGIQAPKTEICFDPETITLYLSTPKQNYEIRGFKAEDFPAMPKVNGNQVLEETEYDIDAFQRMINATAWSLPKKENIEFCWFYFKGEDGALTCYTTCKEAMSKYSINNGWHGEGVEFILPPKVFLKIAKYKAHERNISIQIFSDYTCLRFDNASYIIRTSASSFLSFDKIMESQMETKNIAIVPALSLNADVKSIMPLTGNGQFCWIELDSDGDDKLVMKATSMSQSHGTIRTTAKVNGELAGKYHDARFKSCLESISANEITLKQGPISLILMANYGDGAETAVNMIGNKKSIK